MTKPARIITAWGGKQTSIPGTEEGDVPAEVRDAATALWEAHVRHKRAGLAKKAAEATLEYAMTEHHVARLRIVDDSGQVVEFVAEGKTKITAKVVDHRGSDDEERLDS